MPTIMHSNVWQQTTTLFLTIARALKQEKRKERETRKRDQPTQTKELFPSHNSLYTSR
jgi:hypothetical protein